MDSGTVRRWLAPLGDVLLALAVFALSVQAIVTDGGDCDCQVTAWTYVAAAGQALPIAARRAAPFAVNLLVAPSAIIFATADWPALPVPLGPLIAIHAAASYAHRWQASLVLAGALVAVPVTLLGREAGTDSVEGLHTVLIIVIAWLLGWVGRYRRTALAEAARRAATLDLLRDAERAGAVAAERARIAREMHDLLSHSVSVMVVLAEGGAAAAEAGRGGVATTFDSIAGRGRRTLAELRAMLGVLRAPAETGGLQPLPALADLTGLVAETRQAGVQVSLHGPTDAPVNSAGGLAAYRIVQESLTNAVRHAPGAPVRVEVGADDQMLTVRVTNRAPDPSRRGTGHGLRGMRERAASAGGTLTSGPVDDQWVVDLRLPLSERG
ncbi:signal transduction histidine kinase [Actinoplanes octamycinicus]|uniref:histidine kinase n=1 Tax=Actinoplanes octamycinicus TaxID=135948 RepID=A0A7W7MAV9_9ACTN|nr:histidine kinase [Actinoplanes octamycinicus]MBB4743494.1 signal transduction histidine kinase [Actinoplanes octamycinicus]